jgi:hypothetical protein
LPIADCQFKPLAIDKSAIGNQQSAMKFTRYSKFKGFDVSGINLGELMDSMADALLDSGYDDNYYWTRERRSRDTSLDALRRAKAWSAKARSRRCSPRTRASTKVRCWKSCSTN